MIPRKKPKDKRDRATLQHGAAANRAMAFTPCLTYKVEKFGLKPNPVEPSNRVDINALPWRLEMTKLPDAQLCHIGFYAFDLEKMVDFYSRIFGLVVTDRGHSARGFDIAFLDRHRTPEGCSSHHHQPDFLPGRRFGRVAAVLSVSGQGRRQEA